MPEDDADIRVRPFWSGTISFGLVSIPVDLYPANRSGGVSLRMLGPDGAPLERRYYDPESGQEVPREEIVRGYEVEEGRYVAVTEEELEGVEPEKSRDIDLRRFVEAAEVDPIYFERAYFLTPAGESTKAYRLLAAVMEETGRVGIATFVMRTKEYLVAILAERGILRAETLRFHDEVRSREQIGLPERAEVSEKSLKSMRADIRSAAKRELDLSELEDAYAKRLEDLVEAKWKKGEGVAHAPVREVAQEASGDDEEGGGKIIDIMDVLRRNLERSRGEGRAEEPQGVARDRRRASGSSRGTGRETGSQRRSPASRPSRAARPKGIGRGAEFEDLTKAQLYERAQKLEIPGRGSMSKKQLVEALRKRG